MKKLFVLCLVIALLLSVGCGKTDDPTESAVPGTETGAVDTTELTTAQTTEPVTSGVPTTEAATEPVSTEAPATEAPTTQAPVQTTAAPEPIDPWTLLDVASFDQGSYTDDCDNNYTYSYEIPCLKADTEGARAINAAIDERFGADVRDAKEAMKDGVSLGVIHIGFHSSVWEDVLTVIVVEHYDFDWADYGVYCYEASTGRRLTTPMVLERLGFSEQEFLAACRERFHDEFVEEYKNVPKEYYEQADYYGMLGHQVSDEYVNMDLMVYPDAGDAVVIAPIVSLAGPAYYYRELFLGLGGNG